MSISGLGSDARAGFCPVWAVAACAGPVMSVRRFDPCVVCFAGSSDDYLKHWLQGFGPAAKVNAGTAPFLRTGMLGLYLCGRGKSSKRALEIFSIAVDIRAGTG